MAVIVLKEQFKIPEKVTSFIIRNNVIWREVEPSLLVDIIITINIINPAISEFFIHTFYRS